MLLASSLLGDCPSDVYCALRQNETPNYVVTPMPFNLLGLDPGAPTRLNCAA